MEWKVGEIKQVNDEWYQCIKSSDCSKCDLKLRNCGIQYPCTTLSREDGNEVIFKKLEKIGEPYILEGGKKFQKYIVFHTPYIYNKIDYSWQSFSDPYYIGLEIKQTKEDMEENKLNLKPFDIQEAREGKPVCTRNGRKARIICFDSNGGRPIVALVTECDYEEEIPYKYHCDGSYNCQSIPSDNDLMMLPEKRSGWTNVKKDADLFKSIEEAERNCTEGYAACNG